ncbi:hypothetical protein ACIA8H_29830 [Streptomyces goshikiensis]|uniref:hypothetical protein n=1 Tax=Streptomyces goshikiensis TaxID=1942 RepID=UPI0037BCE00B
MTATQTEQATDQVPARRMPLPGDPEDALIDQACWDPAAGGLPGAVHGAVHRQQRLVRAARVPRPNRLEDVDYDKHPDVSPEVAADLKSPSGVQQGRPLVLIGTRAPASPTC